MSNKLEYFNARQKLVNEFGPDSTQVARLDAQQLASHSNSNAGMIDNSNQTSQGPVRQPTALSDDEKAELAWFNNRIVNSGDPRDGSELQGLRDAYENDPEL